MNVITPAAVATEMAVAAPGYVATATNAVAQIALRNPVATCVVGGVAIGVVATVLAYQAGPAVLRTISSTAGDVSDWAARKVSSMFAATSDAAAPAQPQQPAAPVIDGVAGPAAAAA